MAYEESAGLLLYPCGVSCADCLVLALPIPLKFGESVQDLELADGAEVGLLSVLGL